MNAQPSAPAWPRRFGAHRFAGSLEEWLTWAEWQYEAVVGGGLRLWGRPITASTRRLADGRRDAFWHLVTSGDGAGGRRLDILRAAAIGRVWVLLELADAGDAAATWWREDGVLLVAASDFSLIVVLGEARHGFRLLTAYPVSRAKQQTQHRRRAATAGERCAVSDAHPLWRHDARRGNRWTPPAAGERRRIREAEWAECLKARRYLRAMQRAHSFRPADSLT